MKTCSISLLSLLWMGCTVGPNYVQPRVQAPPAFIAQQGQSQETITELTGPHPESAWWQVLGDGQLSMLIEQAVQQNQDAQIARARVREARAMYRASRSARLPRLDTNLDGQRAGLSENAPDASSQLIEAGLAEDEIRVFETGFDAAWEIDIFGGVRRSIEAADARLGATLEGKHQVLLSIIAETARQYTEWKGAEQRLLLAKKNLDLQQDTLERVNNKYKAGLVSSLDLQRARTQVETTSARLPTLRAMSSRAAHRLAVLTGRTPEALVKRLLPPKVKLEADRMKAPELVPTGLPSELLQRRPDIRQAERQLAAATADIGVAVADLYPRFFLTGSAGGRSNSFIDLFDAASRIWNLGPQIRWPLFRGRQLRAQLEAADIRHEIAYIRFQQRILLALEEVETALTFYAEEALRLRSLNQAVVSATEAVQVAQVLYDQGLEDFLVVLDAERSLTNLEDQRTHSETSLMLHTITLYKALGGGWQIWSSSERSSPKARLHSMTSIPPDRLLSGAK